MVCCTAESELCCAVVRNDVIVVWTSGIVSVRGEYMVLCTITG